MLGFKVVGGADANVGGRPTLASRTWGTHRSTWATSLANPDPALSLPEGTRLQSQVFLRNTTSSPLDVKVLVDWRSATGWDRKSVDFPPINAKATALLDLSELQSQNAIPSYANWATVTLSYSGRDGDLIPISASYADHQRYLMQSPFSDWLSSQWKGGEWEVDANHNSLITTGNAGTSPTRAAVTIYYAQGSQKYQLAPRTLKPGEAMTVNVAELIRTQVPDASGVVLPVGLSSGSYEIRDLDSDVGQLYEGKISIDLTNGRAFYGCALCCSYDIPYITSFDGEVGDTGYVQVLAFNSCSSTEDDKTSITTGWTTDDLGIATAAAGGIIHATGSGSTFSHGSVTLRTPQSYKVCPLAALAALGLISSKPTISGATHTIWWFQGLSLGVSGYTTDLTLTASAGSSYQWNIVSGSDKVSLSGNGQQVHVTGIGKSSTANDVSVTVTVAGQTSNPFKITVRAPHALGTDSLHPTPVYLSDPTYAWETDIYHSVLDNFLSPMPVSLPVNENWNAPKFDDYTGTTWRQPPPNSLGCASTINNSELKDTIFGEEWSRIPTPVYNANPSGAAVQHWGQEWRIGSCQTGYGPRVQTNILQKYTDHASYTSEVTPAP